MNLAKVIRSLGTLSLINFARKCLEKLRSNGDTALAGMAPPLQDGVDGLSAAYAERHPLVALRRNTTLAKNRADTLLDRAVAALSYDLLSPGHLNGNRKHPDYRALFPEGNINFIKGPDRAEVVQVHAMIAYLKANPTHPMADRAGDLETKATLLDEALGPMAAAEAALRAARAREKAKRQELVRILRKTAARLRAELMDEKQVETFFPSVAEARVPDDDTLG